MLLGWTLYHPNMRDAPKFDELYQEKNFRALRVMGVKFWDIHNKCWCMFPDSFTEEKYKAGILQDWKPKPKEPPKPPPVQGSLF